MTGVTLARRPKRRPEFYLDVVVRSGLDVSIADAITGGELERTMEGASTLSLTLHDPHRALVRNPDLARAIDMQFGGYWWRLVKVSKSGDDLTLTFEDRDVAYLRQHTKPRVAKREKVTRAEFIRQLVREVGQRGEKGRSKNRPTGRKKITFVCPELRVVQAVGRTEAEALGMPRVAPDAPTNTRAKQRSEAGRFANRQPGLTGTSAGNDADETKERKGGKKTGKTKKLTVKGAKADLRQRKNGQAVLDIADELEAGPKATLALMEAVIIESQVRNLTYGDRDSIGILQLRVSLHGRAAASSITKSVTKFLQDGFTGKGGAIELAAKNPSWTAAQVAQAVQGSGVPTAYATVADEAREWIDAYNGEGVGSGSVTSHKKYQFRRGEPGKPEDSWTAIQRLAEEVKWHAWMDRGRLYYMSDDYVMRQKARFVIDEDDDGIQEINFDIDTGKTVAEVSVQARAKVFQVPVGVVVRVKGCGLANGRYVVQSVRQGIFDHACEISLRAPTPKLDEPVSESTREDVESDAGTKSGPLRDRIVAVAKKSMQSYNRNQSSWFYSQGGAWNTDDPTKPPKRGNRSDCSQWVMAVYKKAGAPAPGPNYSGGYTGTMRVKGKEVPLRDAKPGDIILYGPAPSHHVELYVGPGDRTIGHGSAPVDYGTTRMQADPHCWRYSFLDADD